MIYKLPDENNDMAKDDAKNLILVLFTLFGFYLMYSGMQFFYQTGQFFDTRTFFSLLIGGLFAIIPAIIVFENR